MKKITILLLLLCSAPASAGQWTQEQVNQYNACFPVLRELKWIKNMRDQNMETSGKKNLAEIEKDWENKSRQLGCYAWQGEFDRQNP